MDQSHEQDRKKRLDVLILGTMGVVFGDIGTSPLYSIKESVSAGHATSPAHIFGVISLVIISLIIVITLKYIFFIMQADNKGEGGVMALVALAQRSLGNNPRGKKLVLLLGMCGVSLFFGDGIITPAISVLSAIEGLEVATPFFKPYILPLTLVVLIVLFAIQKRGTESVGRYFGPVMFLWFGVLATLGAIEVLKHPEILMAISPWHGIRFIMDNPTTGFIVLGSVFLCVTGGEALYADMGHFGSRPIRISWIFIVFPSLLLNYLGQGALLLHNPEAASNPFYLLVPSWLLYPMVALSTAATVIASQAVISGVFSATRQAVQLGLLPRMEVIHTSIHEMGQIYVPFLNWSLMTGVVLVVLSFKSSDNLASAYGIAVTGAMLVDTILAFGVVLSTIHRWNRLVKFSLLTIFIAFDLTFFLANVIKIPTGGWFPLVLGFSIFFIMTTWRLGGEQASQAWHQDTIPLELFLGQFTNNPLISRTPGTAIFFTADPYNAPRALMQNISCNCVVHDRVIILTTRTKDVPYVEDHERLNVELIQDSVYRIFLDYGYQEVPDIPAALQLCQIRINGFDADETYYFLGRVVFVFQENKTRTLSSWRTKFWIVMQHNAGSIAAYLNIPLDKVIELGVRIPI
ncbi:MAG: potassium transporter Kup [Magnetococcales bacterium]|nr:potassium transporter Kup [Magnetococcales bacterium]